jgi:hypothetical protein
LQGLFPVDFTPTSIKNLYSLSFGDLLPDGSIDDMADSNNGDILRVLSTVVQIIKDFILTAFKARNSFYEEVNFQPREAFEYPAFFIKRID